MSNGTAVGKTAIAMTRKFTTNGEKKEEVCYMDIVFFGRSAETANQYLSKGSKVQVTGRITFTTWVNRDGVKMSKHELVVDSMEMINSYTKEAKQANQQANDMPTNTGVEDTRPKQQPQQSTMSMDD